MIVTEAFKKTLHEYQPNEKQSTLAESPQYIELPGTGEKVLFLEFTSGERVVKGLVLAKKKGNMSYNINLFIFPENQEQLEILKKCKVNIKRGSATYGFKLSDELEWNQESPEGVQLLPQEIPSFAARTKKSDKFTGTVDSLNEEVNLHWLDIPPENLWKQIEKSPEIIQESDNKRKIIASELQKLLDGYKDKLAPVTIDGLTNAINHVANASLILHHCVPVSGSLLRRDYMAFLLPEDVGKDGPKSGRQAIVIRYTNTGIEISSPIINRRHAILVEAGDHVASLMKAQEDIRRGKIILSVFSPKIIYLNEEDTSIYNELMGASEWFALKTPSNTSSERLGKSEFLFIGDMEPKPDNENE